MKFPFIGFRLIAVLLVSTVLAACGGGPVNIAVPTSLKEIPNPAVQPVTAWRSDGGDGTSGGANGFQLAIDDGTVYVANSDGSVAAFNVANGRQVWRVNVDKRLISGPSVAGNLLLVGTRDGHLLALSRSGGEQVWAVAATSEVIAPPAANNGIGVVHTLDGRLVAYQLNSGNRLWTVERNVPNLTMRGVSSPVIVGDTVYAGLDNGHVIALDLATGQQLWEQTIALPTGRSELERLVDIDAGLQVVDGQLLAISVGGKLASVSLSSGRVRWKQDIASVTGLAFNDKLVFATDIDGVIHAVNRLTGAEVWTQDALKYRELSAPAVYNGYLVVGDYQGYLHWIDPRTGELVGRIDALGTAIREQPVTVGGQLLVLSVGGEVAAIQAEAHG